MLSVSMAPALNWAVIGLLLLGLELFTGTFVVLFFACGAFVTALITWAGLVESQPIQVFIFTVLSGGGLLLFKDKLQRGWGGKPQALQGDIGVSVQLDQDLPAHGHCSVQYQGTTWTAVNESDHDRKSGEWVKVHRIDGVKLIIK